MVIPSIDFNKLDGEKRSETMATLHEACEKWGFFQVMTISWFIASRFSKLHVTNDKPNELYLQIENHGIDKQLMEKVKDLVNQQYEENARDKFYDSDITKSFEKDNTNTVDRETAFFIGHHPNSNINELPNISKELRYIFSPPGLYLLTLQFMQVDC